MNGSVDLSMNSAVDRRLENRSVLVVADDPIIALDLQIILEAAGATVVGPAYELSKALNLIEEFSTISFKPVTHCPWRVSWASAAYHFCSRPVTRRESPGSMRARSSS